jgi:hypothetical protein
MNGSWKIDQSWPSRSRDIILVEASWAEIPHLWKQNVSTEENVCYKFLYCVDVVKLPLKFILSIYEVK